MIWPASSLIGAGLLDGEALLLAGVDVVDLHRQDAVVAVFEGDFDGPVALLPGRLEFPGNLGELDVFLAADVIVNVPLEDADDDALGRVGDGVIGLGEGAGDIDAALDDRIEIDLALLVDRIGAQRMFELDGVSMIVEPGSALEDRGDNRRPLSDAGHRIDLFERLRFLAGELFGDEAANRAESCWCRRPGESCRRPWPACRAGRALHRSPARISRPAA